MARLRVGIVSCWYKNIAMSNYTGHLKRELEKLNVDLIVVTSRCLCEERYCGLSNVFQGDCRYVAWPTIPFLRAGRRISRMLMWLPTVIFQVLRGIRYLNQCKDCDVIHYQQCPPASFDILPLAGLLLVPTTKVRVVTLHSFYKPKTRLLKAFLRTLYSRADYLIVHSDDHKRAATQLGLQHDRVKLIRHGVSHPAALNTERREVTFFGAPTRRKGFHTVLEALRIMRDHGRQVSLNIYGIYSQEERVQAATAAQDLGVDDLVRLRGRLDEDGFDKKMQESLFTLAVYSTSISGSSIITRALANATPIIASDIGGSREYLQSAGVIIHPNDPASLTKAMTALLDDELLREELGEQCRKRSRRLPSWEEVAEQTLGLYLESLRARCH